MQKHEQLIWESDFMDDTEIKKAREKPFQLMRQYCDEHWNSDNALEQAICKAAWNAMKRYQSYRGKIPLFSLFNLKLPIKQLEPVRSESITLDTETTGLSPLNGAEILQLSIINQDGKVLFNEYFKPIFAKAWDQAMAVNGITPEMVSDKPCIYERLPEIIAILQGADRVIGYNTQFDLSMLAAVGASLPKDTPVVDVMLDFAPIYGEYNEEHGSYRWQKLTVCADYFNYDWGSDTAHDSLADCRATLFCYQKMQELPFLTGRES